VRYDSAVAVAPAFHRPGNRKPLASVPVLPSVSVVVPLYNKRSTVERTIDSVLAQTHADFELVIVDDGSTDDGADFVERRYPDPRVRLHRQLNAGPGAARNHGAKLARGRFLTFLDADDTWRPQLLQHAVVSLDTNADCRAFTAAFYLEPAGVDRWAELRAGGFSEGPWRLTPGVSRRELADCLAAFHSCTTVYRREAFEATSGFYAVDRCTFYRHIEPLAHYHMDASELGMGSRRSAPPLEPVFTKPEAIRQAAPAELKGVLELWLGRHALRAAFVQLERGDPAKAAWLLAAFPGVKGWVREYAKIRLRMAAPHLWALARKLRRSRA